MRWMRTLWTEACLAALAALLLGACHRAPDAQPVAVPTPGPDTVAVFRGGEVTRADLAAYQPRAATQDPIAAAAATAATDPRIEEVTSIALLKALAAEAPDDDPDLAQQRSAATEAVLRQAVAHELGWDAIAVTEEEARQQFATHPEQYHTPEKIRLQNIFLRAERHVMPDAEREQVRERLEAIRRQILDGAEFSAMARTSSQSSTAASGGWMALSRDSVVEAEFARAAWALDIGEISPVIETPAGFEIARLAERLPASNPKYEDVAEFARRRVRTEKLAAAQAAFLHEAGARYGLVRRYDRLADRNVGDNEALLEVGEFRVTFADLRDQLPDVDLLALYNRLFAKAEQFLDQAARNRLLVLEAHRLHLADRPDVAAQLAAADQQVRAAFAFQRHMEALVAGLPRGDLEHYFLQNQERYQTLKTMTLSVIFLALKPGEPLWGTLRRGEALVRRLRAGEDFATLARQYSDHYSAAAGGRMEDLTDAGIGRLVQARASFRNTLARLKVGEVSDAIIANVYDPDRLQFERTGILIVRVDAQSPPQQQPFAAVEPLVRANYLRRSSQALAAEARRRLVDSIDLKVLTDRLPPL